MSSQLEMQVDLASRGAHRSESYRRAMGQIQALDGVVKKGDAQQAETALATAETAVKELQTQDSTSNRGGLDVYA